jgi:putative membrane protein (TIGR04086 family)
VAKPVKKKSRIHLPRKVPKLAALIIAGVMMSLAISAFAVIFLSVFFLVSESSFVERNLQYVIVGITMISIFLGSVYATFKVESKGLIVGLIVGLCYVSVSILIGFYVAQDNLSIGVLLNKYLAGIAAGGLGGLVGVNLS